MRKRTQLVGFEFGYWKHTQYCAEFLDNALDAIEYYQWEEIKKKDSQIKYTLDQDVNLENLSITKKTETEQVDQKLDDEVKRTIIKDFTSDDHYKSLTESGKKLKNKDSSKKKEEIEEIEVSRIITDMVTLLAPAYSINIIDKEPLVIIRMIESEAHSLLTGEIDAKNVMTYQFEIFDNGHGMSKVDLRKYGKYLASSKSTELKQTRGSQGFGAPSAFSDSQNTTGRPIVVVSKNIDNLYASASEFFTTSKNEKKYAIHPTEIDSPFLHGTYIKLNYLNIKYVRGYVDTYIQQTALMNPHVTLIFIDPYKKEFIFPRKVSSFPSQPKYAKPHPSSTNIGDLQDLLAKSDNTSLLSFFKENFVRMSSKIAKEVTTLAENDIQDKLDIFILKSGYINKTKSSNEPIYFIRNEQRIYGKSTKPRDKTILYEIISDDLKNIYWEKITEYKKEFDNIEKIYKKIKLKKDKIQNTNTKKEINKIKNEIQNHSQEIEKIRNKKEKLKLSLDKIFKINDPAFREVKNKKIKNKYIDLVKEVKISEAKTDILTNNQFNSLFYAFKSIKYMSPPTDTVVPVGDIVLENTIIKELGLRISENLDDFGLVIQNLIQSSKDIIYQKAELLKKEHIENIKLEDINAKDSEVIDFNSKILSSFYLNNSSFEPENFIKTVETQLEPSNESNISSYKEVFEYFIDSFTREDDFVAAETRDPTSGKGLAYVVEAVMAYSNKLGTPKRSRDVLSRFVNRTPKLRDTADCAITKAVQNVKWKNYNLELFENNLPKGPIRLLVNVSGPYVHLMFKSQSKNALADDERLISEIKYCLEAIGRKLRIYLNRRAKIHNKDKRANLIEKYIPFFVESLYNIASKGGKYKDQINTKKLEILMREAIRKPTQPMINPPISEIHHEKKIEIKKPDVEEIKEIAIINKIPSIERKSPEFKQSSVLKVEKSKEIKRIQQKSISPKKPPLIQKTINKTITRPKPPTHIIKSKQTKLPIFTTEVIMNALDNKEWQNIKHLIFKLRIKDMLDARLLQVKLKGLERIGSVLVMIKMGKHHWKLK
ncbi:MAG: DNA topoisomerase VI subunit B [Candidatus Lokiarchaeota archaeon]|nr:DNA topoisomerase VI subunit B [Candidatus Lokiarchaeota archaeon]